jgi:hypothetical protein
VEDLVFTYKDDSQPAPSCTPKVATAADFKAMLQLSSWADVFRALWLLQGARLGLHRRATNNYNNDFRGKADPRDALDRAVGQKGMCIHLCR